MYANYIVLLLMLWFILEFVGVHSLININHPVAFDYLLFVVYRCACVLCLWELWHFYMNTTEGYNSRKHSQSSFTSVVLLMRCAHFEFIYF